MAVDNLNEFFHDLDASAVELRETVRDIKARLAFKILADYIRLTPVDTGFARSGWYYSEGDPGDRVPASPGDGVSLAAALVALHKHEPFGITWIYNNVVYIVALDEGHSQQAPAGMTPSVLASVEAFAARL